MPRFKLIIEYDGGPYVGWQRQENGASVQQAIEAAIAAFSGETVVLKGAGRTDSGVHALGQVAHFDLASERTTDTVRDAINAHLKPQPIAILSAEQVGEDFDARFSARRSTKPPCTRRRRRWSATMTSPPSAPPNVRRSRR
jgi:tRNA pseudouridine38-40 synthase